MAKPQKLDVDKVLEDVSRGMSILKACKSQGCSQQTFYNLKDKDPVLKDKYVRACEERGYSCLDKIEEYQQMLLNKEINSSEAHVLIETEKWKACKFYPKMFGDKQAVELTGADGNPISPPVITIIPIKSNGNNN